jgi:hypothetical protein
MVVCMKCREAADLSRQTFAESTQVHPVPELPAWKAFVVQFSRDTGTEPGVVSGRVEHLSSGRRARFNTSEELLAVLQMLLDELRETSVGQA